jgi:predicted RNA-binding protein YlqC (UPF0109 family)
MDLQTHTPAPAAAGERAIEEMLLFIARSLTDHPDDVKVQFVSDDEGNAFQILAHQDDLGLLIGKKGQTARAIESILNSNRRRSGFRYHLDIVGPEETL